MAGSLVASALIASLTLAASAGDSRAKAGMELLQSEKLLGRFSETRGCPSGPYLILTMEGVSLPDKKASAPSDIAPELRAVFPPMEMALTVVVAQRRDTKTVQISWRPWGQADEDMLSANLIPNATGFRMRKDNRDPGKLYYRC